MNRVIGYTTTLSLLAAIIFSVSAMVASANPVINEADAPKFLYTMSAKSGTFENGRLTLNDVPLVVYFADRPARISGQLSIQVFAQGWGTGTDSFKNDPPNATLSILGKDGDKNTVVELSDPNVVVEEGSISFKVRVLDGELPETFEHSTLFIDGGACPNCIGAL
ncbi:MAG: hypothetical protein DHS20C13_02020 [Thermodesulfobacteriota bacterium]|nr:MAG: hypothetical protein DHS20C13_02020 [Thermodesulfobacteriota bacterium]